MPPYKWGVCLDFDTYDIGLFQTVVQYTADEAGEMAIIMSPVTMIHVKKSNIRELQTPPQFSYGEKIVPHNHFDINGNVVGIYWHFKLNCFYYRIRIADKIKSKRYFEKDLISFEDSAERRI